MDDHLDEYDIIKNTIIFMIDDCKYENLSVKQTLELVAMSCWARAKME